MAHRSIQHHSARSSRSSAAGYAFSVLGLAPILAGTLGCGAPGDEVSLARSAQPILNGEVDERHPQVMLLASRSGFICSGSVVQAGVDSGLLLTAAHCVTEETPGAPPLAPEELLVIPGTDFALGSARFSVDQVFVQPEYDGDILSGDVALVRFLFGEEPAPSALRPLLAADGVAEGDTLTLVGYGQTESDPDNSQRRSVERRVDALDEQLVAYSQEDGSGSCFGDSGGPALLAVAGKQAPEEVVAAVISGGVSDAEDGCSSGFGVATRVSAYADFISAVLAGGT